MSSNSSDFADGLHSFGPATPKAFDFTPLFETALLSILPSVIFLIVLPIRLFSLHKQTRKVAASLLHSNKLVFLAVFTVLQATVLILYAVNSSARTPATIVAVSLVLADTLGLCFLSHVEHVRSVRPSTIINTYLFVTLLFDIARTRTLWIENAPKGLAAAFTAATVVKMMIAIIEGIEKRRILLSQYQEITPEATSGIYSRSVFWWLNALLRTGFRRVLDDNDLFPVGHEMTSAVLKTRAQDSWNKTNKTQSRALFWSTLKATRLDIIFCVFPRLCLIGFRYAQPFLLARTVSFVDSARDSDSIGWGLTMAFGLVFLGKAVSSGSSYHMAFRFVTTVRGTLVTLIYAKTVDLSVISLDESAAITLMSKDAETICEGFQNINELWAVPIELAIAVWLLQRQLGLSFLAPTAVALISTTAIFIIANYIGGAQKIWNKGIQTRVHVTATMLGSMKAVKILGFTDKLTYLLQGLRIKELKLSYLFRRLLCVRSFFGNSITFVAPLVTMIAAVSLQRYTGKDLNSSTAYTALSLLSLLSNPLNTLLRTIPMLTSALACFDRIQSFLESDSRQFHILPLQKISKGSDLGEDKNVEIADMEISIATDDDTELKNLNLSLRGGSNLKIVDVRHASFAWNLNSPPVVNDATFSVLRGNLLFIIGPVGCGKSTLLKGLISETPSSKGFVYSDSSSISFVDQTPWIQNISIQQNIVGQSNFEKSWYEEVTRACALDYDIAGMPSGGGTIVGSRGISLSGGQKQRLAIARALYAKKELMIIDDAFSGLDADTEEKVFVRLFGKQGLLRRLGTTVILVTHAVHRLPYADHIIALTATGHIVEQGNFDELLSTRGYVAGLATKHKYDDGSTSNDDPQMDITLAEPQIGTIKAKSTETEDDVSRQSSEFSTYMYYFASIGWSRSLICLSYMLVSGIAVKVSELVVTYWTSAIAAHRSDMNAFYLGIYGMLFGLGMVGYTGGVYHYFLYLVPGTSKVLHARLLYSVMNAPLQFFASTDTGTTTNRFSQDMSIVDGEIPYMLIDLIFSVIITAMGALLMCISAGYFTLTLPPVFFAVWVIQRYYLRTSRQIRLLDLEAKAPLYTHFIESLSGLVTIRAFGWSEQFVEQNLVLLDRSQKPYYLLFCIQRWLSLVLDLMVAVLAIILMVLVVKLRSSIGPGYVGLALLNVMSFSESLTWNIEMWTLLETAIGAIARLKNFTQFTPNENLPTENQVVPENWPSSGGLELKGVTASYTESGNTILKKISMSIKPGEKIGVCGRSGSGKSSLMMTLFRMLEVAPDSSMIVDGIDITKIPRQVVRSRFNAIPQDPFFMTGSIRFNASPEVIHTDAEIIIALQKVRLWTVVEAKGGLDAELDTEFFSHGQRQLFCLARAILRKSKIVMLDEVSSSIDVTTDRLIQKVIREEFKEATIIAVAHRLETILDYDRIALLSDGKLVEFDAPEALLGKESAFRELYNS